MDLADQGARVGTAGFVLARLLLEPPSQALAENFSDLRMRATWPLQDAVSARAVESLGPDAYEELPRDHSRLFRGRPPLVPLRESAWRPDVTDPARLRADLTAAYEAAELRPLPTDDHVAHQLTLLGHLATRMGPAPSRTTTAHAAAADALAFRDAHLDLVIDPILEGITQHARTRLYAAVPDLVRGFLAEQRALCAVVLDLVP